MGWMRGGQGQEIRAEMWVSEASLRRDPEMEEGAQGGGRERGREEAWSNCPPSHGDPNVFLSPHIFNERPGSGDPCSVLQPESG